MWVQHALPLNNEEKNVWVTSGLSTSDAAWIHFQRKYSSSLQLVVCVIILVST